MRKARWLAVGAIAIGIALWGGPERAVGADDVATPSSTSAAIHGAGGWGADDQSSAARGACWDMDALTFADNRISGRINVCDSPLFEAANVEGRFSGHGMSGRLLDDEGKPLASFEGRLTDRGADGTYRDYQGGTGTWHWDGPVKP